MKNMVSYMKVQKNSSTVIYVLGQFISLTIFLITLFGSCSVENSILFLPFAFFAVNSLFFLNYIQQNMNLTKLTVFILYFIRLSVLPFLYYASGETRLYEGNIYMSSDNIQKAVYLMIYEYFIVQLIIFLHERVKIKGLKLKVSQNQRNYNFFPAVLFVMTLFSLVVYVFLPEVRESFKNIFMLNTEDFTVSDYLASNEQVGSVRRIIATLFSVVFTMIRILLPAYFLVQAKKKCKSGVFILIISIIAQFIFITSTFAQSIVAALTLVLLFGHLYPKKKKFLYFMIVVLTVGIVSLYFLVRYSVGNGMYSDKTGLISYIARIVSAYFTGVENVAGCFNLQKGAEFETAVSDLIGAIPFNTTLFGSWSGDRFQTYFNNANHSHGQISPAIGSGYYHFGWILSPIYVVIMLKLSLFYCENAKKDTNPWKYAIDTFCCIVFSLGLVMYNEAIAFSWYLGWGVLMLLVLKFTNKDEIS